MHTLSSYHTELITKIINFRNEFPLPIPKSQGEIIIHLPSYTWNLSTLVSKFDEILKDIGVDIKEIHIEKESRRQLLFEGYQLTWEYMKKLWTTHITVNGGDHTLYTVESFTRVGNKSGLLLLLFNYIRKRFVDVTLVTLINQYNKECSYTTNEKLIEPCILKMIGTESITSDYDINTNLPNPRPIIINFYKEIIKTFGITSSSIFDTNIYTLIHYFELNIPDAQCRNNTQYFTHNKKCYRKLVNNRPRDQTLFSLLHLYEEYLHGKDKLKPILPVIKMLVGETVWDDLNAFHFNITRLWDDIGMKIGNDVEKGVFKYLETPTNKYQVTGDQKIEARDMIGITITDMFKKLQKNTEDSTTFFGSLSNLASLGSYFADDAMLSYGATLFVVAGQQQGIDLNKLDLTHQDLVDCAIENIGSILIKFNHYIDYNQFLINSSKFIKRIYKTLAYMSNNINKYNYEIYIWGEVKDILRSDPTNEEGLQKLQYGKKILNLIENNKVDTIIKLFNLIKQIRDETDKTDKIDKQRGGSSFKYKYQKYKAKYLRLQYK